MDTPSRTTFAPLGATSITILHKNVQILHKIIGKAQSLFANSIFASDKTQLSICKLELITIHKMETFVRIPLFELY